MTKHQEVVPLVTLWDGEPFAATDALAIGVKHSHESVIKLVRKYQTKLELFGLVRFEIRPRLQGQHGGGDVEIALLTEPQATLLVAMMRNTAIVVDCKVRLVQEFFRMRELLNRRSAGLWQKLQALIASEVASQVRASFGSRLMLVRKREIPAFESERRRLESEIQPDLTNFH